MNILNMSTSPLPAFYKSVFRVWNLLRKEIEGASGFPVLDPARAGPVGDPSGPSQLGRSESGHKIADCGGCYSGAGGGAEGALDG